MKKLLLVAVLALLAAAGIAGWRGYSRVVDFASQQITDDLFMITGLGGNVAALRTEQGTVLVDTMTFAFQGAKLRELAESLTGQPVTIVINTHYHQDHTHGNPGMAAGTRVVATERTKQHLLAVDGSYWEADAAAFLPGETFEDQRSIEIAGKTLELIHPGPGHTDGDLVVLFVEDRTLHAGDLLWNGYYPNIDLEAGGSIKQWPAALLRILELDFDHVIPGHGPVGDRETVRNFERFMEELGRMGQLAADREYALEQTLAEIELTRDDWLEQYIFLDVPVLRDRYRFDRDFVLKRAWEEATGAVKPHDRQEAADEEDSIPDDM